MPEIILLKVIARGVSLNNSLITRLASEKLIFGVKPNAILHILILFGCNANSYTVFPRK